MRGGVLLLAAAAIGAAARTQTHTGDYWADFVNRPHFAHRLLHHPATGAQLREAAECDLRGTWRAVAADQNYTITLTRGGEGRLTFTVAGAGGPSGDGRHHTSGATAELHMHTAGGSEKRVAFDGVVSAGCEHIHWTPRDVAPSPVHALVGRTWRRQRPNINKVHVVFMNHLDIGYAIHPPGAPVDPTGYMLNVVNEYTSVYFPKAAALANSMRAAGPDRFVYTTHPWLVSLYIDCPPNYILANGTKLFCPTAEERASFEEAVARGDITWHDGPFNLQSEMVGSPLMFKWGLQQSLDINAKLNHTSPADRKIHNLRDVPGTTRAVVPLLARNGYKAITVGQNPGTPPTNKWNDHKMFRWVDTETGTELLYMNHAGGYPNDPGSSVPDCGGLCPDDCMMNEGLGEALCFAFRTDNAGPPADVATVQNIFSILRAEFPGASVRGSTLDSFVEAATADTSIYETVTQEIADTWTQGAQSDPKKQAQYRAFVRAIEKCAATDGSCRPGGLEGGVTDWRVLNATRLVLTLPEHTWGLPGYGDQVHWSKEDFNKYREAQPQFTNLDKGWQEHRTWLDYAIEALEDHPLADLVRAELTDLARPADPVPPTSTEAPPANIAPDTVVTCAANGNTLRFDAAGAITQLSLDRTDYADAAHTLGELVYSTYVEQDFAEMTAVYIGPTGGGCGFAKPGMDQYGKAERLDIKAAVTGIKEVASADAGTCTYAVEYAFPAEVAAKYGAPTGGVTRVTLSARRVDLDMRLEGKSASRLAESAHVSFSPVQNTDDWRLRKLGSTVDPYDIIENGNPKQHGVWGGVSIGDLTIDSQDIAVVSPITPESPASPFLKVLTPPPRGSITGMGWNLFNNIWETNYPFYYPFTADVEDTKIRARFSIEKN